MRQIISLVFLALLLQSCNTSGVDKNQDDSKSTKKSKKTENVLDQKHTIVSTQKLQDEFEGASINWFEQGNGENIVAGDVVAIDFKLKLPDGTVVDGNHLMKKEFFPFMVGYKMQTDVWDYALQKMKIGDFVEIKIPAKMARGNKGLGSHIPANADNILVIRALKKLKPNRTVDGTKVWIIEEDKDAKLKFEEGKTIVFHSMASSPTNGMFANTFRTNRPFEFKLGDQGIVPGLRKALINAKSSDRMYVLVPPADAYGSKGYMEFVKPGEAVFYNLMVMEILEK